MTRRVPLICFHGIVEGKYEAEYPVFVVGEQLLEAVHIVGDREAIGFPIVPTGIALCALHHGAFDGHLMTVRPDYRIEVRRDLLEESDGPTLIHGLQGFHGQSIGLPPRRRLRPDAHLLEIRYERVREVSRSA